MFFPFDEKSIKHIKIRVGGTVLLKQFLLANDRYHAFRRKNTEIVLLKTYRFYIFKLLHLTITKVQFIQYYVHVSDLPQHYSHKWIITPHFWR